MNPSLLSLYIARRFGLSLAIILAAAAGMIFLAEYVETLRRFGDLPEFSALLGVKLASLRVPLVLDGVLAFAFLFAALLSLLGLSGKLELVIARASGISVWGFLRAPFAVALLFGIFAITVFNPFAVDARDTSRRLESELSGSAARRDEGYWFRQTSGEGQSIVYSANVSPDGRTLFGVAAIVLDANGKFQEKVSAARADFREDRWVFADAEVISATRPLRRAASYDLPTQLRAEELLRSVDRPRAASIWSLPAYIAAAERTGISSDRFRLALHTLLSRPLFLLAMVTVAATVSLRLTRYGGTWRLVLTGVIVGFLLYVFTEIVSDLGDHGIIDPVLAAWWPPLVALAFGVTALLYQEDG